MDSPAGGFCGKPSDMKSAKPRMKSAIPSVTRKDVMPTFATRMPLASPIRTARPMATTSASSGAIPALLTSVYMTRGTKPKTLPTERSKTPAVSSRVIPRAMMPNSGMKANMFEMLVIDTKAGSKKASTTHAPMSSAMGMISGCVTSRCRIRAALVMGRFGAHATRPRHMAWVE